MKLEQVIQKKKPTYHDFSFPKEVNKKINQWRKQGLFFGAFPVKGDSMTCDDDRSIPSGSKVLAVELNISDKFSLGNGIPLRKPLLIKYTNSKGEDGFICKTINFMDFVNYRYRLKSYNPKHQDAWIPIRFIDNILEVHHVF